MPVSRGIRFLLPVALVALALATVHEWRRPAPPEEVPVPGRLPVREDETSRTEGGFSWTRTREGRVVFRLEADSLVGVEGGAHFVRGVRRLELHTEDGRRVVLGARAARVLREAGRRGREAWELALEGSVSVRDPGGTVLEADRLDWSAEAGTLVSPGPATVRGRDLLAHVAGFEYRPAARVLVGEGPVDLTIGRGPPVRVDADRFVYRLAEGTVELEEPFRARRPRGAFHAAGGELRRTGGGWDLAARGPVLLAPHAARVGWTFAAAGLEAREEPGGEGPPVEAGGPGILAVSGPADGTGGTLAATRWSFHRDPGQVRRIEATEGLEGSWRDREGKVWKIRADRLDAREGPGGAREVRLSGNLVVGGPGDVRATGDRVTWNSGRPGELRLSGTPRARVARGPDTIEAPRFLLDREGQVLTALDAPITDVRTGSRDEAGLFRGGRPVRVRSRRVTVPLRGGRLVFEGPLMAWQENRDLRASRMSWDPRERILEASGDVVVHVVRAGTEGGPAEAGWLRGDRLRYAAEGRVAEVEGNAEFQQPGGLAIRAATIRVVLDREGAVERLLARTGVTLRDRQATGSADVLEWTGGPGGTVVLRAGDHLPEIRSRSGGSGRRITAPEIRYDLSDGSIRVSGAGGRTRLRAPASGKEGEGGGD